MVLPSANIKGFRVLPSQQHTKDYWDRLVSDLRDDRRRVDVTTLGRSTDRGLPIRMITIWPRPRLSHPRDALLIGGVGHEEFTFLLTQESVGNSLRYPEVWNNFAKGDVRLNIIPDLDPETHQHNDRWLRVHFLTLATLFKLGYRPPGRKQAIWGQRVEYVSEHGRIVVPEPQSAEALALETAIDMLHETLVFVMDGHNSGVDPFYWVVNSLDETLRSTLAEFARSMGVPLLEGTERGILHALEPGFQLQPTFADAANFFVRLGVDPASVLTHGGSLGDLLVAKAPEALHVTCEPQLFPTKWQDRRRSRMDWSQLGPELRMMVESMCSMTWFFHEGDRIAEAIDGRRDRLAEAVRETMIWDAAMMQHASVEGTMVDPLAGPTFFGLRDYGQAYQVLVEHFGNDHRNQLTSRAIDIASGMFQESYGVGWPVLKYPVAMQLGTFLVGYEHATGRPLTDDPARIYGLAGPLTRDVGLTISLEQ